MSGSIIYAYVGGNPLNFIDSYGLWCVSNRTANAIAAGVGGAVGGAVGGGGLLGAIAGGVLGAAGGYASTGSGDLGVSVAGAAAGIGGALKLKGGTAGMVGGGLGGAIGNVAAGSAQSPGLENAMGGLLGGPVGGIASYFLLPPGRLPINGFSMFTSVFKGGLGGFFGGLAQDAVLFYLKSHTCPDQEQCSTK